MYSFYLTKFESDCNLSSGITLSSNNGSLGEILSKTMERSVKIIKAKLGLASGHRFVCLHQRVLLVFVRQNQ